MMDLGKWWKFAANRSKKVVFGIGIGAGSLIGGLIVHCAYDHFFIAAHENVCECRIAVKDYEINRLKERGNSQMNVIAELTQQITNLSLSVCDAGNNSNKQIRVLEDRLKSANESIRHYACEVEDLRKQEGVLSNRLCAAECMVQCLRNSEKELGTMRNMYGSLPTTCTNTSELTLGYAILAKRQAIDEAIANRIKELAKCKTQLVILSSAIYQHRMMQVAESFNRTHNSQKLYEGMAAEGASFISIRADIDEFHGMLVRNAINEGEYLLFNNLLASVSEFKLKLQLPCKSQMTAAEVVDALIRLDAKRSDAYKEVQNILILHLVASTADDLFKKPWKDREAMKQGVKKGK